MKIFIITYTAVAALAAFSNAQAQNTTKNPDLPDFQYLLTSKPEGERQQLCELNKGFCQTNCGGPNKAPKNFCNPTTMGWGCGCIDKVPDLLGYEWPINREHCIGSGEACKAACADPKVPNENKAKCNTACVQEFTQKCGTPAQPPTYYAVSDEATVPTYGPPTEAKTPAAAGNGKSDGGLAPNGNGNGNENNKPAGKSSASTLNHLGSAAAALVIIASGMSLL